MRNMTQLVYLEGMAYWNVREVKTSMKDLDLFLQQIGTASARHRVLNQQTWEFDPLNI